MYFIELLDINYVKGGGSRFWLVILNYFSLHWLRTMSIIIIICSKSMQWNNNNNYISLSFPCHYWNGCEGFVVFYVPFYWKFTVIVNDSVIMKDCEAFNVFIFVYNVCEYVVLGAVKWEWEWTSLSHAPFQFNTLRQVSIVLYLWVFSWYTIFINCIYSTE